MASITLTDDFKIQADIGSELESVILSMLNKGKLSFNDIHADTGLNKQKLSEEIVPEIAQKMNFGNPNEPIDTKSFARRIIAELLKQGALKIEMSKEEADLIKHKVSPDHKNILRQVIQGKRNSQILENTDLSSKGSVGLILHKINKKIGAESSSISAAMMHAFDIQNARDLSANYSESFDHLEIEETSDNSDTWKKITLTDHFKASSTFDEKQQAVMEALINGSIFKPAEIAEKTGLDRDEIAERLIYQIAGKLNIYDMRGSGFKNHFPRIVLSELIKQGGLKINVTAEQADFIKHDLSARTKHILRLIAQGHGNGDIAKKLNTRENVIAVQLSQALKRLEMQSSLQIAAMIHALDVQNAKDFIASNKEAFEKLEITDFT